MKVGFVLDDTLDTADGIQQYILTLGTWLVAQGHSVHYLVGQTKRTDIANVHSLSRNIAVRFNGNRMSMPLPTSRRELKSLLSREQFDILHVQVPYSPLLAHRIILAAPLATTIFGTFHIAPNNGFVAFATRALALCTNHSLQRFDRIVSVSKAAAHFAKQTYRIDTSVLPNVVDESRFKSSKDYAKYTDKPAVMFLGRLVPRKGCMLLLEAVSRLRSTDPDLDFRVVICGRGPLETELKAYAKEHNLLNIVEFTGYVKETDKPRFLASADLAVFPSSGGESFGIVLIEAMAAGKAVVLGADNPGYASVLEPYPDVLFPVGDAPSLAHKIRIFLTDTTERQKALDWQASYISRFDVAVVGTELVGMYEEAIQKRAGSAHNSMR